MSDPADYACRWDAPSCKARVDEEVRKLRPQLSATEDMAATLEADVLQLRARVAELETDNKFLTEMVESEYGDNFRDFYSWVEDGKGGGYAGQKMDDQL